MLSHCVFTGYPHHGFPVTLEAQVTRPKPVQIIGLEEVTSQGSIW
jgi:hypothetical protein